MRAGIYKGLFSMAAMLALATAAQANELKLTLVSPPGSPDPEAVFELSDDSVTQPVAGFNFQTFYKSSQVASITYEAASGFVDADLEKPIGDMGAHPSDSSFDHSKNVNWIGDAVECGPLVRIRVQPAPGYTGNIELKIQNFPDPSPNNYIDDNNVPIPIDSIDIPSPAFAKPTIAKISTNYAIANEIAGNVTVTITGTNFIDGRTKVQLPGLADITPAVVSSTQMTAVVPKSYLDAAFAGNADTVNLAETLQVFANNNVGDIADADPLNDNAERSNENGTADNFYVVSRDKVWVDNTYALSPVESVVTIADSGSVPTIIGANAFGAIASGAAVVNDNGTVRVHGGTQYVENAAITKTGTKLEGYAGASITAPVSAENSALVSVQADDVSITGMDFDVNAPDAVAGVFMGAGKDNVTVVGNTFDMTGNSLGGDLTSLLGFNVQNAAIVIKSLNGEFTIAGNRIGTAAAPFSRGIWTREAWGTIGGSNYYGTGAPNTQGNEVYGVHHDVAVQFVPANKTMLVSHNDFNGWGNDNGKGAQLDFTEPNGGSVSTVSSNRFNPQTTPFSGISHLRNAMAKNAGAGTITFSNNEFNFSHTGFLSANSLGVSLNDNTFTPQSGVTNFTAIEVSNKVPTNGNPAPYQLVSSIHGNHFNGTGGVGIEFMNYNAGALPVGGYYGTQDIGGAGALANHFAGTLNRYIKLNNESGSSTSSSKPEVANLGASSGTPMMPFAGNMDVSGNEFNGTLGSTFSVADGWAAEDKIDHKLDVAALGFVRTKAGEVFVTDLSDSIQRGIDAATAGDTVHIQDAPYIASNTLVNKPLTLKGQSKAGVIVAPAAEDGNTLNDFANSHQYGFIIQADDVTFDSMTIDGQANAALTTGKNNFRAGMIDNYNVGDYTNTTVQNVAVNNTYKNGIRFRTVLNRPVGKNIVQDCTFANNTVYGSVAAYNCDTDILRNVVVGADGFDTNYTNNTGAAPLITIKGNTISGKDSYGVGMNLSGLRDGSTIGGPLLSDRNVIFNNSGPSLGDWGIFVQWTAGQVTLENNLIDMNNGDAGIGIYRASDVTKPVIVKSNVINSTGADTVGVWMTDDAALFTEHSSNDCYATLENNIIDGCATGVELYRNDSLVAGGRNVVATIGGAAGKDNTITNCGTAIRVYDADGAANGNKAVANILNNAATLENCDVAIDVDGGSATIQGNTISNNDTGIKVQNGGVANVGDYDSTDALHKNVMTANAKHFAFEVTASGESSINSLNPFAKNWTDLESVVYANDANGKTYITEGMTTGGLVHEETVSAEKFTYIRSTIQGSVNSAVASNSVNVMPGKYIEDVNVNKALALHGTGTDNTTVSGAIGGGAYALNLTANGILVENFTVTREGNNDTDWNNPGLNSGGLVAGGNSHNNVIRNNNFFGNRNGILLQGTSDNLLENNTIDYNRTGLHLVDLGAGNIIRNNFVRDNWTAGVLFRSEGGPLTNNLTMISNDISGNWYAEVECRDSVNGNLNLSGNWFGTNVINTTNATGGEPGYAAQIPAAFPGGSATAPGSAKIICGANVSKVDFNGYLDSGSDLSAASGFQGDMSHLHLSAASPLKNVANSLSHINDALEILADGSLTAGARLIELDNGTYTESGANVTVAVTIQGRSGNRADAILDSGAASGFANAAGIGIEIASSNVTVQGLTMRGYLPAINRSSTQANLNLANLQINESGRWMSGGASKPAVRLAQLESDAVQATAHLNDVDFSNVGYAAVACYGGETELENCDVNISEYLGFYANDVSNGVNNALPAKLVAHHNSFTDAEVGIRSLLTASGSSIHHNTFNLGVANGPKAGKAAIGASVEWTACPVEDNTFNVTGSQTAGLDGEGGSMGVFLWNTDNQVQSITNNTFTDAHKLAHAIVVGGNRPGDLVPADSAKTLATVTSNTIDGFKTGVKLYQSASAAEAVTVTINGNNEIKNCDKAIASLGAYVNVTVENNPASIHGNTVGVDVASGSATINNNHIYNNGTGIQVAAAASASVTNNDFDGGSDPDNHIDVSNAGTLSAVTDNDFAASRDSAPKYVVNTSGNNIDATDNTYSGDSPASLNIPADNGKLWNIENKLVHKIDNVLYGFVRVKEDHVFATAIKGAGGSAVIQRAVTAADPADTVNVQTGLYEQIALVNKMVKLTSADGPGLAIIDGPANPVLALALPATSGNLIVDGFTIKGTNGNALQGLAVSGASQVSGGKFVVQNCAFTQLNSLASGASAIGIQDSTEGIVTSCSVTANKGSGIVLVNSANIDVLDTNIVNNRGTAFTALDYKNASGSIYTNGLDTTGVTLDNCVIADNGKADPNADAYGIFFSGANGAAMPFGSNNSITSCTIRNNAATGIWLTGQNSDGNGLTDLYGNDIAQNGTAGQNTDGVKIRSSRNTSLVNNYIRNNVRAGVLVSSAGGGDANSGENTLINRNHIYGQTPDTNSVVAGLLTQIYTNPTSSFINANDNWWGHVYGPVAGPNTTDFVNSIGRGDAYENQGGKATIATWYGKVGTATGGANLWYALNDRDGDGIKDADEDRNLDGTLNAGNVDPGDDLETNRLGRDSDGDNYEDGVEVALGYDPRDAANHPADTNLLIGSTADSDNDGYKDFYEVAMKTNPNAGGANGSIYVPWLGDIDKNGDFNATDLSLLRQVLVGSFAITDPTVSADNMDINRDGAVSNIDAIGMRRFYEGSITLPMQ